jgi:hypothetical protein
MDDATRAALERARTRLETLALYPRPVSLRGVRVVVAPWWFRIPTMRRFDGWASHRVIVLRRPLGPGGATDDLLTHELCHVWQMQHHPLAMPLSYLWGGYWQNRFEVEARAATARTAAV